MAKGVLNNIDLGQENPNLSYEGIQRFNPNQRLAPKMGTLKRILSASKESEKISPFKKAAPKPVQIKTAKPAPVPVTQASPITTNVLQPVVDINETAAPAIRTSTPAPIAPVATPKQIVSEDVLSPIEDISIQDNTKVKTAIKNLADRAYSGDRQPLYARDVYENDIKQGILEGDLSTYEDEEGNLSVKRNAPGLVTGVWEGQKMVAENIRKASKYYISSPEEKVKLLEEDRMVESMQPMQESSTGTQIGQTAGNILGQIVLGQAPRFIPGAGALLGSAISSAYMGAMQAYDSEKEAYNMARENGLNEYDAYDVAEKGRGTYYATGVAENFVSALVGARVGTAFKATASGASKGFKEAIKRYAYVTGNKSLEVGLDASVAAISSGIRDLKTEQTTGLDLNVIDRALENAKMEAYAGGAMAVLGSAYGQASKTIPKWLKSQALNMASTMEEPSFITLVDNLKQEGVIDEEGGKRLIQDVQNWNTTSESNIDVPAEKAGVINGLTTKKQGLLDKLKTADESSKQAIQSEIDAIDTQISEARTNPDLMAGEVDDLTGLPLIPKITTDATQTTQEQQQEGVSEGDVSQRQGTEGQQDQATNEADNRNRPISEQEEVVPKTFDTEEGRRVISEAQGIVSKTNFRQGNKDIATENAKKNVVEYIKGTKFYENANDVDREQMLRDAQKYFFDTRFKSSPAVTKLFSELEPKKITLNEQSALRRLMRFGEKSAKTAFDFAKDTRIAITDGLRQLEASGKIANKQFVSIMSRYDRINLKNPESIDRFVTYVSKVISDATFNDKIAKAQKLRSLIKRGASLKTGQVNISAAAKAFARINPLNVRDINEYMKIAEAVLDGVKTSKSTKDLVVKFNQAFSTADTQKYIDTQNVFIENENKKKRLADYEYLVDAGVLTGEMSLDEMDGLISDIESGEQKEPIKDKNRYIMAYVQERFDALAPFAQELLDKGEDTFGGTIDKPISEADKKSMSEVLKIGITNLPIQDAYRVIESMDNFVANGETYGLDDIIARYESNQKSKTIDKSFIVKLKGKEQVRKGRKISLFFSDKIGRFMAKQVESLPIFAYKMFRSAEDAAKFFRETGLQDLFNHKNEAKVESKGILADFVGKFEGKMANGTVYNDAKNTIEQGMFAFLRRNKGGSPEDIKTLFDTNKRLIIEGIDNLRKGNSEDVELADIYQEVYDKIASEANTIADVEPKVDKTNIEVVNYWTNVWAGKYDALRGVSKAIYRQELDKDNFFNPIAYRKIKKESKESDIEEYNAWNNSGFSYNYEGNITKKMSGTLMKQKGVESMPENKYLNFNFIKNSYGSLESALTDIYTAKDVRYVKAMLDSDGLKKIVHEEDIPVLKEKVALYIKRSRNMDTIDYDELSALAKKLGTINRFSTSLALASIRQVSAQTVPLAVKTLITSGRFDLGDALSITMSMYMGKPSAVNDFLDKSGYGVSIRGLESAANLQELNRLVTESNGDISKIAEYINNTNDKALKLLLSNPDSIIARASWISYYKAALKAKGQDIDNINWETHKIDQESADTAEENVNTQQNASDPDMQGALIGSKKSTTAFMRNVVMPFSGFIMNTKAKIQADTNTLLSKVTTKEEKVKAARNLAGQLVETHIYTKMGSIVTQGLTLAVGALFGEEESERRYEKLEINEQRGLRTNFIGDTFNPLPASFNTPLAMAVNAIADAVYPDTPEELKIRLYDGEGKDNVDKLIESAGLVGIGVKQAAGLTKSIKAAATGEMETEFAGQKSTKYLSEEEREMLVMGSVLQMLYMTRLVPVAEFGTISNKILTLAEKRGLTEKKDVTKDVIEEVGATIDTKTIDGKSISQAAARAIVYTDPEERARYIIGLQDKYGIESVENMLGLLEEAKVLDNGTVANILAIQGDDPNLMKVSRLFSYKKQDARVQKLMAIRDSFEDKADFYSMLKWGMQFKVLNQDGILLLADKLEESSDFTEDEIDMLISVVED